MTIKDPEDALAPILKVSRIGPDKTLFPVLNYAPDCPVFGNGGSVGW